MIDRHKLTEYLTLNLLHKATEGVTVYETALFGIVSVKVKIKTEPIFTCQVVAQLPYGINRWLP